MTQEELQKLKASQDNSNKLVEMEIQAMKKIESSRDKESAQANKMNALNTLLKRVSSRKTEDYASNR